MKEQKQEKYAKLSSPPKPNLKNKDFVKWSRAEMVKREDNIISSDWHEKLQKTGPFNPAYDNVPLNMVYLISGEYSRLWLKERDEWYSNVFVLNKKEKDMESRKKKIQKDIREAKKAAEVNMKERKERRAREAEAKAKAEAERMEKLKAKIAKLSVKNKPSKKKKEKEIKVKELDQAATEQKLESCPKGWTQVELTVQCECSSHQKEKDSQNAEVLKKEELTQDIGLEQQTKEETNQLTICPDYIKQLQDIQYKKSKPKEIQQANNCQPCLAKLEPEVNAEKTKEVKPTLCPHCMTSNSCPYCMQNQKDILPTSARLPCQAKPEQDLNPDKIKEMKPFCQHCFTPNSCPYCMQHQKELLPTNIKEGLIKPNTCPHCSIHQINSKDFPLNPRHSKEGLAFNKEHYKQETSKEYAAVH